MSIMDNDDAFVSGLWPTGNNASFQLLTGIATPPVYKTAGAAGFDIAVTETFKVYPNETHLFSTGLIIKPPTGYWTMIVPRSSLQKKGLILANQVGVIDEDYCGPADEIKVALRNLSDRPVLVEEGDRVVQGIFLAICRATFHAEMMSQVSRGGFGSTGR